MNSVSQEHHDNTKKLHADAIKQISVLENQIKELGTNALEEEHQKKLKTSALSFSLKTRDYIEMVGGMVWLSDQQDELDEVDLKLYRDTVLLMYGFAMNLFNTLKEE